MPPPLSVTDYRSAMNVQEFADAFDYVMIFKLDEQKQQTGVCKKTINTLLKQNFKVFAYNSVQQDEVIVMLQCSEEKIQKFADAIDYELLLDRNEIMEAISLKNKGFEEYKYFPTSIANSVEIPNEGTFQISPYDPYQFIFGKYEMEIPQHIYQRHHMGSLFTHNDRLKLIYAILRAPSSQGGCCLRLNKMLHKKQMLAFFPLHRHDITDHLVAECTAISSMPWAQPCDRIRDYYGEKIALYHLFLGNFATYLIFPSIVGFVFQLVVWGTGNVSHPVLPFFGIVITLWAIFMLEGWKRAQAKTALEWGMTKFEDTEQERPEYAGVPTKSFVDGTDILFFPTSQSSKRVNASFLVIGSMIMLVLGVVASIYYLRFSLQSDIGTNASTVASILNAIQIQIFNMIYQTVVKKLTDFENHRTDTQYEDSVIVKLFAFQFVNSYSSFFFVAFIAENLTPANGTPSNFLGQCGYTNCMQPLMVNLVIIFGTRLVVQNVIDLVLPYVMYKMKYSAETKGFEDKRLTPAECDYLLLPYNPMMDSIANYADTAIQFGFMALFVTALPIAAFFAMVNAYVKIRILAYRHAHLYQRPVPTGAQDIGTWQSIFALIAVIAVVTNAAIICFTMDLLDAYSYQGKLWVFIGFQWTLISLQYVIEWIIPDVPEEVEIQSSRTKFIVDKLIMQVPDEGYGEVNDDDDDGGKPVLARVQSATNEKHGFLARLFGAGDYQRKEVVDMNQGHGFPQFSTAPYPFEKNSGWPKLLTSSDKRSSTRVSASTVNEVQNPMYNK